MQSNARITSDRKTECRNATRQDFFNLCLVLEHVVGNKKISKVMSPDLLHEIGTVLHRARAIKSLA
jgi:hypothetical protein